MEGKVSEERLCTLSTLLRRLQGPNNSREAECLMDDSLVGLVLVQVLDHLSELHAFQNQPHGRIRPWNVDFTTAGRVIVECRSPERVDDDRWYLPPERLMGFMPAELEQDSWSVGILMAEMILGTPIFSSSDTANQLYLMFKTLGFPSRQQVPFPATFCFSPLFEALTSVMYLSCSCRTSGRAMINWSFHATS